MPAIARLPFSPHGILPLTPLVPAGDVPSNLAILRQSASPRVGKFSHPSDAPDNHLLTVWSAGPLNHKFGPLGLATPRRRQVCSRIRLSIDEPGQMWLIKNDPKYKEQWPRALVPYRRNLWGRRA